MVLANMTSKGRGVRAITAAFGGAVFTVAVICVMHSQEDFAREAMNPFAMEQSEAKALDRDMDRFLQDSDTMKVEEPAREMAPPEQLVEVGSKWHQDKEYLPDPAFQNYGAHDDDFKNGRDPAFNEADTLARMKNDHMGMIKKIFNKLSPKKGGKPEISKKDIEGLEEGIAQGDGEWDPRAPHEGMSWKAIGAALDSEDKKPKEAKTHIKGQLKGLWPKAKKVVKFVTHMKKHLKEKAASEGEEATEGSEPEAVKHTPAAPAAPEPAAEEDKDASEVAKKAAQEQENPTKEHLKDPAFEDPVTGKEHKDPVFSDKGVKDFDFKDSPGLVETHKLKQQRKARVDFQDSPDLSKDEQKFDLQQVADKMVKEVKP